MDHPIPSRRPDLVSIKKKELTGYLANFAVPADHSVKTKQNKKINKYLELAWELKRLRNMWMIVIPIIIGAFETFPKDLEKGL